MFLLKDFSTANTSYTILLERERITSIGNGSTKYPNQHKGYFRVKIIIKQSDMIGREHISTGTININFHLSYLFAYCVYDCNMVARVVWDIQRICIIVSVTTHISDLMILILWITNLSPRSDVNQQTLTLKELWSHAAVYIAVTQELRHSSALKNKAYAPGLNNSERCRFASVDTLWNERWWLNT